MGKNQEMSDEEAFRLVSQLEEAKSKVAKAEREREDKVRQRDIKLLNEAISERDFAGAHNMLQIIKFKEGEREHYLSLITKEKTAVIQETLPEKASLLRVPCRKCNELLEVSYEESFIDNMTISLVGYCRDCKKRSISVLGNNISSYSSIESLVYPLTRGQLV